MFVTFFPINKAHQIKVATSQYDDIRIYGDVASFHPDGANLCFLDGSVHFVREDIDSWDLTDAEMQQIWDTNTVTRQPGLSQALSTRHGGEVIGGF